MATEEQDSKWPRGIVFPDDPDVGWTDTEDGVPNVFDVANAIQIWAIFNGGPVTVRQAGDTFNLDDAQVRQAVEAHAWMYLAGPSDDPTRQTIEHEGE